MSPFCLVKTRQPGKAGQKLVQSFKVLQQAWADQHKGTRSNHILQFKQDKRGKFCQMQQKADGLEKLPWEECILVPAKLSSRVSVQKPARRAVSSAGAAIASWLLTHLVLMLLLLHTNVGFWSPYYHTKGEVGIEAHSSTQQWAEASWNLELIRKGGQKKNE